MQITITEEQISSLVLQELEDTLECFRGDMETKHPGIFFVNEVADKLTIQKHIEALELIISWYEMPHGVS